MLINTNNTHWANIVAMTDLSRSKQPCHGPRIAASAPWEKVTHGGVFGGLQRHHEGFVKLGGDHGVGRGSHRLLRPPCPLVEQHTFGLLLRLRVMEGQLCHKAVAASRHPTIIHDLGGTSVWVHAEKRFI
jgi:hypothetical protein